MKSPFDIKIISSDADTVLLLESAHNLLKTPSVLSDNGLECEVGHVAHIPGAMGGWYELAIAFQLSSLPVATLANVFASWITNALQKTPGQSVENTQKQTKTKLILRNGNRTSELIISTTDPKALIETLRAALEHVDQDS